MSEFESEILARYKKLKNENVDSLTDSNVIFASLGYDTMWTGAMALHGASQNPSINLSSFTYENDTIRDAIYKSALGVNFTGATVSVLFFDVYTYMYADILVYVNIELMLMLMREICINWRVNIYVYLCVHVSPYTYTTHTFY